MVSLVLKEVSGLLVVLIIDVLLLWYIKSEFFAEVYKYLYWSVATPLGVLAYLAFAHFYFTLVRGRAKWDESSYLYSDYWSSVLDLKLNEKKVSKHSETFLSQKLVKAFFDRPEALFHMPRKGSFVSEEVKEVKGKAIDLRDIRSSIKLLNGTEISKDHILDPRHVQARVVTHFADIKWYLGALLPAYFAFFLPIFILGKSFLALGSGFEDAEFLGIDIIFVVIIFITTGYFLLKDPPSLVFIGSLWFLGFIPERYLWNTIGEISYTILFVPLIVVGYLWWRSIHSPIPPRLYLYVNDERSAFFPYDNKKDSPWWIEGKYYWVWRYVFNAPAEITKPWESDWERVDLWIRADGSDNGKQGILEWIVTDYHYRELWFDAGEVINKVRRKDLRDLSDKSLDLYWLINIDINFLFHTPEPKNVCLIRERFRLNKLFEFLTALNTYILWLFGKDVFKRKHTSHDELKNVLDADLFCDIAEHARENVAKFCFSYPWKFWRYPKGVTTLKKDNIYGRNIPAMEYAADEQYQRRYKGDFAGGHSL